MTRPFLSGVAIFFVCLAAYVSTADVSSVAEGWDTLGTRVLPFAILRDHRVTLDSFSAEFSRDTREVGYLENRRGHLMSHYPIGAAIAALPVDLPIYAVLSLQKRTSPRNLFDVAATAEIWSAGFICAAAVLVLFRMLVPWAGLYRALGVALVFGLGTSMWAVASQELWQHGPDVLFLLLGLFCLSRPGGTVRSGALAGVFLGFLYGIRPAAAIFAVAGFAYLLLKGIRRRRGWRSPLAYGAGAIAAAAPFLFYNLYYFDNPMGGTVHGATHIALRNAPLGILGLFFSPNRGLLFYTPVAVVGLAGMGIAFRQAKARPLLATFSAAAIAYALVHCSFARWAGGWSFGPRYLIEILPVLALTSILALRRMRRPHLIATGVLALLSILIQIEGGLAYGSSNWEARMGLPLEAHAWDWRHLEMREDLLARSNVAGFTARPNALPPDGYRVRWGEVHVPPVIERKPFEATVRFQNASPVSWLGPRPSISVIPDAVRAVRLGCRWFKVNSSEPLPDDSPRADLSEPLLPGQWTTLPIDITPPDLAGDFELHFDLVQEFVSWFSDQGANSLVVRVRVK